MAMIFTDSSDDEQEVNPEFAERLKIDWIDLSCVGYPDFVAVSELPGCRFMGRRRNLQKDIDSTIEVGIGHAFILCSEAELAWYRIPNLLEEYQRHGVVVHHHPFSDSTAPSIDNFMAIIKDITSIIENGERCLINCLGGLGRSCVLASCILLHHNDSLTEKGAVDEVRQMRGPGALQTVKQYNYVYDFRSLRDDYLANNRTGTRRAVSR